VLERFALGRHRCDVGRTAFLLLGERGLELIELCAKTGTLVVGFVEVDQPLERRTELVLKPVALRGEFGELG
jgi:hypothetical protein